VSQAAPPSGTISGSMANPLDTTSAGDATQALGIAAARSARRNRPMFLIVLALLTLAFGLGYAFTGWLKYRDARAQATRAQQFSARVLDTTAKLKAMQENESAGGSGPRPGESGGNVLSRIEGAGPRAGLTKSVPVGSTNRQRNREVGWDQVLITYNIKDPSLDAILKWAELAVGEVAGLEVSNIALRPEQTEWSMTVVFSRWENPEGSQ